VGGAGVMTKLVIETHIINNKMYFKHTENVIEE